MVFVQKSHLSMETREPPEAAAPGSAVMHRIVQVIGVRPSRADLIAICAQMGWATLTRKEKRVKAALVQKLEAMRASIVPLLGTPQGVAALQGAYVQVLRRQQGAAAPAAAQPAPPSLSFLLSRPVADRPT